MMGPPDLWVVVGTAVGIIGTAIIGYFFSPSYRDRTLGRSRFIRWHSIDKAFELVGWLGRVRRSAPTVIVAVNDGLVPAAIVARNLDVREVHYVISDYDGEGNPTDSTVNQLSGDFKNKNILLLDDQVYKGDSMRFVYDRLPA